MIIRLYLTKINASISREEFLDIMKYIENAKNSIKSATSEYKEEILDIEALLVRMFLDASRSL